MSERTFNDLIREERPGQAARRVAFRERLFGPDPEPEDAPSKPPGDADGGKGEAEDYATEYVQTEAEVERMRVFTDDELNPDTEGEHR
ncbi:MAG: hypothetical protein AABM66_14745 [Actinomycetota bacterium]